VRKLTLMISTTLDARVAGPGRNLEWFRNDAGIEEARLAMLHSVDAMIFGRVTYEELAGFWPNATTAADRK
jgi:dihydrofolate reductase